MKTLLDEIMKLNFSSGNVLDNMLGFLEWCIDVGCIPKSVMGGLHCQMAIFMLMCRFRKICMQYECKQVYTLITLDNEQNVSRNVGPTNKKWQVLFN